MGKVLPISACVLHPISIGNSFLFMTGGVGKTTMAAAVVRESVVRNAFTRIAWVSVGQTPAIMELQRSLFNQLTGNTMPIEDGATAETQHQALTSACVGQRWLIILDDVSSSEGHSATCPSLVCSNAVLFVHHNQVWEKEHETMLSCADPASASKMLITSRIRYGAFVAQMVLSHSPREPRSFCGLFRQLPALAAAC